jgi:hypothetical protein
MKRIFLFIFIIVGIVNCLGPPNDKDDYSWLMLEFGLPAIEEMQRQANNICNHLETIEELLTGNTYEFYNSYGLENIIKFSVKGIKIDIEVLQSDRTLYPTIYKCINSNRFPVYLSSYVSSNIEYIGGIHTYRGYVAKLGAPLTIKVWEITYQYYIFLIDSEKTSGYYEDAPANFKITLSEL